jgi:hypothetical protein
VDSVRFRSGQLGKILARDSGKNTPSTAGRLSRAGQGNAKAAKASSQWIASAPEDPDAAETGADLQRSFSPSKTLSAISIEKADTNLTFPSQTELLIINSVVLLTNK